MDELLNKGSSCGLDADLADLAIGGYLHVLKVSDQPGIVLVEILDFLGDDAKTRQRQPIG